VPFLGAKGEGGDQTVGGGTAGGGGAPRWWWRRLFREGISQGVMRGSCALAVSGAEGGGATKGGSACKSSGGGIVAERPEEAKAQEEWGGGSGPAEGQGPGSWAKNRRWPQTQKEIPFEF
jgi:hypothetical protein